MTVICIPSAGLLDAERILETVPGRYVNCGGGWGVTP